MKQHNTTQHNTTQHNFKVCPERNFSRTNKEIISQIQANS